MSLGLVGEQIDIARGEHKGSRKFCQAMIVVVIVGLFLFAFFAWWTSDYYLAIGAALGAVLKPLFDHMSKLSGDNVALLEQSAKIIAETPKKPNQDNLSESLRRQQLSERQRRH